MDTSFGINSQFFLYRIIQNWYQIQPKWKTSDIERMNVSRYSNCLLISIQLQPHKECLRSNSMLEEHYFVNVLSTLFTGLEKQAQSAARIKLEDQNQHERRKTSISYKSRSKKIGRKAFVSVRGYCKENVSRKNPECINDLRCNVGNIMSKISAAMCS